MEDEELALGSVAIVGYSVIIADSSCFLSLASLHLNLNIYGCKVADKYLFGSCNGFGLSKSPKIRDEIGNFCVSFWSHLWLTMASKKN